MFSTETLIKSPLGDTRVAGLCELYPLSHRLVLPGKVPDLATPPLLCCLLWKRLQISSHRQWQFQARASVNFRAQNPWSQLPGSSSSLTVLRSDGCCLMRGCVCHLSPQTMQLFWKPLRERHLQAWLWLCSCWPVCVRTSDAHLFLRPSWQLLIFPWTQQIQMGFSFVESIH